jgi:riboflavin synthase
VFTGIVEEVGTVSGIEPMENVLRIRIDASRVLEGLEVGASVSIDGACHTAIWVGSDGFEVESVGTTVSRTISGSYVVGSRVNLERAAVLGRRLDGHLVQGHVDGVGQLLRVSEKGDYRLLDFRLPEAVLRQTILHGSVCLNGISLTVSALEADACQVAIVPHTWAETNLVDLSVGAPINVEGDMIGKFVARLMGSDSHVAPTAE